VTEAGEALPGLSPEAFDKMDGSADELFYSEPRFVTHIDDQAIAAVTALYRELFPAGGAILDLMGSWVAHLPPEIQYKEVVGHGMSAAELAANPRYSRWFVQNLNAKPALPLEDAAFDGAGLCVSVQYLQRPVAVFREARRVLKPGAPVAITFSNRCFPTKAIAIWTALGYGQHERLVRLYLEIAGFPRIETRTIIPPEADHDPLWAVIGRA